MTEIWEFDEHATSSVPARCPMTDTYGHDEAAAFIAAVLPTYGEGGWWRNEMEKLAAYITRLEAADTRLLAAAEAMPDLGYNCPSCGSWNYLHPQELSDADSIVECGNEDCAAQVRIVVNLTAAIEQAKEGRS